MEISITSPKPLTAELLYEQSEEFRSLLAAWLKDGACPLCLGDFLEEQGLPVQAQVARWAVDHTSVGTRLNRFSGDNVSAIWSVVPTTLLWYLRNVSDDTLNLARFLDAVDLVSHYMKRD